MTKRRQTHIFLQIQCGVVHERLDHSHEINQQGQVILHNIHTHLREGGGGGRENPTFISVFVGCILNYQYNILWN